ncbi:fimbrillin family protein [Bacteroides gallinaceum]|uniref:Fimbrillin family protein n=1 Tax=Bacteroides gallinaceum TaxID=1462571 RepID=A0ABT7VEJ5_9BACE|nr:fimbrillin family protein [Bacteroides gallinaceum]MDM8324692.1 fimbrillin family protein [Bacteroides gallinaceum]
MKKIVYSLLAAAMVAMSSCQDEMVENPVTPAQTGDEITFGSSLTDIEEQTRTIYGDEPVNGAYPVTWEDGDQIAIYCPEASNGNMVYYKVTPDGTDASHSSAVTKVNPDQAGLQWGQAPVHHFSAFYPADRIVGLQNGKITATIPVQQTPVSWKTTDNDAGGKTYTGVANTDYAFMWAYNTHQKSQGGDVALNFKPWVTILDVEINGPETAGAEIKMSAVQLVSTTGETLNGEFTMDFTKVESGEKEYPTYEQAGNPASTRSYITIQLYDSEKNDFITLRQNDKIVIRFYLLPKDDNYDTSTSGRTDLQLRVTPYNSAVLTRTLNAEGGTQTGGILAHKVNKVILPSVSQTGPNYWMSSLDPNIYLTELSLPGSKFSYQNTTDQPNVSTHYQSLSVADQIKNGIRAFHVQTIGDNVDSDGPSRRDDGGNANSMELKISVAENKTSIGLKDMVKTIANGLKEAETNYNKYGEYAFILLTYSGNGSEGFGRTYDWGYDWRVAPDQAWMQAVKNDLAKMAEDEDTYRLYTGEITPSTTLRQVAGRVIIKVNYNNDNMANYLSRNDRVPALFSIWGLTDQTVRDDFEPTSAYAINMLRWGTSNHNATANMRFFYHEASSVGHEESAYDKENNIKDMWERSINYYKTNSNHDMWFMNDVGGYYYGINGAPASESQIGIDGWTEYIGPIATEYLQSRTEDATLGIVLLNYADPANDYSGNLIQTIINNNFSFQLRTSGSSSQSNTYNAAYSKGGNAIGWD